MAATMWPARCTEDEARVLVEYDHHGVTLGGEPHIVLSAHLLDDWNAPFEIRLCQHEAGRQHPPVPQGVAEVLGRLHFAAQSGGTPGTPPARVAKQVQRMPRVAKLVD